MAATARRLTLEIDSRTEPITGRLADEHNDWPFSGWLALAAALQQALNTETDPRAGRAELAPTGDS